MRIISQDRKTNVPYEDNVFCIISDEDKKEHMIAVRNSNLTGFMPLGTYKEEKAALKVFEDMSCAALSATNNYIYYLK